MFVQAFKPHFYNKLIDFVYYRFDFGNFSFKLKGLMKAFENVKSVHIQTQSDQYIKTEDLVLST